MAPLRKIAGVALLLAVGLGCDRFGDGLTGTPPPGDTTLTFVTGTFDVSHFPDITATFTLSSDSGPVENLELGNVAIVTKEFDVEIDTTTFTATGSVTRGPDPVVPTKITKDPLILGTYTVHFRTKTSGYWSFELGFDYGGLKTSVSSVLIYQGSALPILPPATPPGAGVMTAGAPGGGE